MKWVWPGWGCDTGHSPKFHYLTFTVLLWCTCMVPTPKLHPLKMASLAYRGKLACIWTFPDRTSVRSTWALLMFVFFDLEMDGARR